MGATAVWESPQLFVMGSGSEASWQKFPWRTEGILEWGKWDIPYGDPNGDPGIQGES